MLDYNKNLLKKLVEKYNLGFIVLFGSAAKNLLREDSDIDIAIKTEYPVNLEEYAFIQKGLARIFKTKDTKIGLVEISHLLSPLLKWQIAKYGKLLAGDPLEFQKFRLYALRYYFDTKKFRSLDNRYITQNLYAR